MSKGALATELSEASGLKKGEISTILDTLAEIGTKEVKKNGKFTLPGLCMIKTRKKKATKGGKRMMFGKEVKVKPQPHRRGADDPVWDSDWTAHVCHSQELRPIEGR